MLKSPKITMTKMESLDASTTTSIDIWKKTIDVTISGS